jgi:hypothetical protein
VSKKKLKVLDALPDDREIPRDEFGDRIPSHKLGWRLKEKSQKPKHLRSCDGCGRDTLNAAFCSRCTTGKENRSLYWDYGVRDD